MSLYRVSLAVQTVKDLLQFRRPGFKSLGQEDPLAKEMATYSNILSWKISWTEEPDGLQSMGLKRVGDDRVTKFLSAPVLSSLYFVLLFL